MNEEKEINDFTVKFKKLTESNQKYIVAIQRALIYAQDVEKAAKEKSAAEHLTKV